MGKILLQFIHPALERSKVNRCMIDAVSDIDQLTLNDLYEEYPDFNINVKREQQLCEEHDKIVFQFPFYWYSSPSLLKEWFDLVLQYGWGFGAEGKALLGKQAAIAISTGADEASYSKDGHNLYTIDELLRPMEATFHLCGLKYKKPFVAHNAIQISDAELNALGERYKKWILED